MAQQFRISPYPYSGRSLPTESPYRAHDHAASGCSQLLKKALAALALVAVLAYAASPGVEDEVGIYNKTVASITTDGMTVQKDPTRLVLPASASSGGPDGIGPENNSGRYAAAGPDPGLREDDSAAGASSGGGGGYPGGMGGGASGGSGGGSGGADGPGDEFAEGDKTAPFDHWSLNVKGTDPDGTASNTPDGLAGGGMLTAGKTDSKVNEATANSNSNPAESLRVDSQEEATEISIGRSLLDDPETKSDAHLIACVNGAPLRRVLVREHLGIAKANAEDFFARFLPLMGEKHLVLDIGANKGQFAVPLASLGHTVISFEPSQSTCDILRKNLENANVTNRVEVHCAPAAKQVETLIFHTDPKFSARSGLISPEETEVLKKSGRGSEVTMKTSITVDLSVGDRDVFLLKTDTQGYEMSVLEGATQVLKKGNVKFLLIEFSYILLNKAGTSPIDLINYVYDHGYMCTYLGFHTVTQKVKGEPRFSMVDAPQFDKDELSVSFEMFVKSLEIVVAPDAPYGSPGWSDLFCWKRCMLL